MAKKLLAVSAVAFATWMVTGVSHAACPSAVSGVITFDTTGTFDCSFVGNSVVVNSGVSVNGPSGQSILRLSSETGGSIRNNGAIVAEQRAIQVLNSSTLNGDIVNDGTISSTNQSVILFENSSVLNGDITNNGTISTSDNNKVGIEFIKASILNGDIVNNGMISSPKGTSIKIGSQNSTLNGDIINSFGASILSNANYNSNITISGTLNGSIINDGMIKSTGWDPNDSARVYNTSILIYTMVTGSIFNSQTGEISSVYGDGIKVGPVYLPDYTYGQGKILGGIYNAGLISGVNGIVVGPECDDDYYGCDHGPSEIHEITNIGEINGANYGISSGGVIATLNNHQGTTGSGGSALTYAGNLPTAYNMIVYGDAYGQLAVDYDDHSGSLTFGIYSGDTENGIASSQLKRRTYVDVMTGLHVDDIENEWAQTTLGDHRSFGTHDGMLWMLRENITDYSWNLEILNVADNFFLNSANAVSQGMSDLQGKIDMGAGSPYDCKMGVDQKGCVSLKGGYVSQGDGTSSGATAVLGGFMLNDHVRVGGFLEQGFAATDPDNVDYNSSMPSLGAYLSLSQRLDSTGIQAKSSFAMSRGEAELSRTNLLGSSSLASGSAGLNGYALAQSVGYGYALDNWLTMTPYIGIGYISATRDSYTEDRDTSGVDDQFSYDSYNNNSTVGTLGVAFDRDAYEAFDFSAGAGLTYVLASHSDDFEATSDVAGIESISASTPYDATRQWGVASYLGAGYDITDTQKIVIDANVWRSVGSDDYGFGVMAGWSMAFGGGEQPFSK